MFSFDVTFCARLILKSTWWEKVAKNRSTKGRRKFTIFNTSLWLSALFASDSKEYQNVLWALAAVSWKHDRNRNGPHKIHARVLITRRRATLICSQIQADSHHSIHSSVHVLCWHTAKWSEGVVQPCAWNFQAGWIFLAGSPAIITTFDPHRWSPGCFQPGPFVRHTVSMICCSVTSRRVPGFLLSVNKKGSLQGADDTTTQAQSPATTRELASRVHLPLSSVTPVEIDKPRKLRYHTEQRN